MLRRLRKNKKGFTLVELIIVIVILVALAAIAIPSVAGYINRATEAKVVANARAAYTQASVVIADELLAGRTPASPMSEALKVKTLQNAGLPSDAILAIVIDADGSITSLEYTESGKRVLKNATVNFVIQ